MAKIARDYTMKKYLRVFWEMHDAGVQGFRLDEIREKHKVSTILTSWAINNCLEQVERGIWRWVAEAPNENMVSKMLLEDREKRKKYLTQAKEILSEQFVEPTLDLVEKKNVEISILWGMFKISKCK